MARATKDSTAVKDLQANPDRKHWEAFRRYLIRSDAKYYKVFYPRKLKSKKDLVAAYAIIYDSMYAPLFRIPVTIKDGNRLVGATIYMKGLLNTNKDYDEWIA